jgi:hypothetical protein
VSELVLGPLLRYVGERDATVWVETDAAAEVEVLGHRARTFEVAGHHFALVQVEGLDPGTATPYEVLVDGERRWPPPNWPHPPSAIRTIERARPYRLLFGSCRTARPHQPPYTLRRDESPHAREFDALYAYALRMRTEPRERWPDLLLWLGDQVYADDVSRGTLEFIRSKRDVSQPPGTEVANFEEYTHLYLDAWSDPLIRWLLSTVSSAMIFDDHDVHDDWNTSKAWVDEMRAKRWWQERIVGGLMSYWIYQHLGNLSPRELAQDPVYRRIDAGEPAGPLVRDLAERADRDPRAERWSYYRDLGDSRLVVLDSRAGRVLSPERRMLDEREWGYVEEHARGDVDHLLLASSVPWLLSAGLHYLEQWDERVCDGAWGAPAAAAGEAIRQGLDLEHWAAFDHSFRELSNLTRAVAEGRRGEAPGSVITLSGDVHHAYLYEVGFRRRSAGQGPPSVSDRPTELEVGARAPVYQAVCSPMRNALSRRERQMIMLTQSRPFAAFARALARAAGARDHDIRWRPAARRRPWFGNQLGTIELDGRSAVMRLERPIADRVGPPRLERLVECRLA